MAKTTLYTTQLVIVVTADIVAEARGFAAQVDPSGSPYQLFAALSKTGLAPATHFWCHWTMLAEQELTIKGKLNSLVKRNKVFIYDGHTIRPQQVFAQLGLKEVVDI